MARTPIDVLMRRAKFQAIRFGFKSMADDFAQHVALFVLEHPDGRTTIYQMWIDYIRVNGPRSRHGKKREQLSEHDTTDHRSPSHGLRSHAIDPEQWTAIAYFLTTLTKKEFEFLFLYIAEDWTFQEIAEYAGVTESRICQVMKPIRKAMHAHLSGILFR